MRPLVAQLPASTLPAPAEMGPQLLPWTMALTGAWMAGCKPPPAALHGTRVLLPLGARFAASELCLQGCPAPAITPTTPLMSP